MRLAVAIHKIHDFGIWLEKGKQIACEYLLSSEGAEDRLSSLGQGGEVEVSHLCDIQEAMASIVVKDE